MILQYQLKKLKNSLVYEEVEQVIHSIVDIPKFDEKELSDSESSRKAYRKINEVIRRETNAVHISNRTGTEIALMGVVKAITVIKKDKDDTYLFDMDNEIYLLNNEGKTIRRL